MSEPAAVRELRPRKGSFIFPRIVAALIIFAVVGAGTAIAFVLAERLELAAIGPVVFLLGSGFVYYAALVAYRKEHYELHSSHVRCRRGGLTSDQTTELDVRNITHVKLKLPWLRHKFFGVGDVMIESAGSGGSEVVLRSIREPESVYAEIRALMQKNGYSLQQQKLLHEERPDFIGVVVECIGLLITACIAMTWALADLVMEFGADAEKAADQGWVAWAFLVLGPLFALIGFVALLVHYLDLRRRTYRVFDDMVVYEEGFLSRENAFIPYENIADANTKRTMIDQILGLYDVQVSCQGSGSEIKFRRLRRGTELSGAIDRLVASAREKPKPAEEPAAGEEGETSLGLPKRKEPELVAPEDAWTADLKMNSTRVLLPVMLWLPLFPVWVMAMINSMIQLGATRYSVRGSSVRHSFKFLSASEREFAYDKITGLVIKENPWDRLFKTVTVRLWSIGSGQPMDLAHVRRDQVNVAALLRQVGIPTVSPQPYAVEAAFGPLVWLRGRLPGVIFLALVAAALVICGALVHEAFFAGLGVLALVVVIGLAYSYAYYARQRLSFHEHHVQAELGVFFKSRFHARYSNVKKVLTTRYPGCDQGALQIFVAGEHRVVQQKKGQPGQAKGGKTGATMPYSFTAHFVTGITDKQRLIDDFLCGRVGAAAGATPAEPLGVLSESQPAAGNTVLKTILLSLLIVPLAPLLPLTIPIAVVWIRRWRYRVEAGRVVVSWGILFKSQASVLFDRIDTLRHGQGLLNKIFGNGNVTLMTAGSSQPDLLVGNAPDYEALYGEIRKHYGKKA